jgi:RNA polymerase sigma-70 factor (ECF subfamily)
MTSGASVIANMQNQAVTPADAPATAVDDTQVLTRRLCAQDEQAFREFHSRYFDRLTRFLLMVTAGNEEQTADALQNTLVQVVRHARMFQTEGDFWNWLRVVARNSARDLGRKQSRYRNLLTRFALAWNAYPAEHIHERSSFATALEEGLSTLPPDDRELVENKYFAGHSVRALAQQAGLTERAVEAKLFRLRRDLRERVLRILDKL